MILNNLENLKHTTRIVRKLGRIVIPKKFREKLKIEENDKLEIYLLEEGIYITKK